WPRNHGCGCASVSIRRGSVPTTCPSLKATPRASARSSSGSRKFRWTKRSRTCWITGVSGQHPYSGERVDFRAFDHPADLHEFLRAVRYGEDARAVGERGHAAVRVKTDLEKSRTCFERRRLAVDV